LTGGFAFGTQGTEVGHVLLNGKVDALCMLYMLYMQREKLEIFALGDPCAGAGEGFVDGKLGGVVAVRRGEGAEFGRVGQER
jgi:hypothetical protein